MTRVQNVYRTNELDEFNFQQNCQSKSLAQKIAVLMRRDNQIDILVLSGQQGQSQFIPNIGNQIADGLSALIDCGVLPEAASILVVHHADSVIPTCSSERRIRNRHDWNQQIGSFPNSDLKRSVRADIAFLRASDEILENTEIRGLIYDGRSHILSFMPFMVY